MRAIEKRDSQVCIREVWAYNLDAEMKLIGEIVGQFPFVATDTEFPGVVIRPPVGTTLKNRGEYNYQTLKANVDALHLIQLGLTFSDVDGNLPDCGTGKPCVWQFNFKEFDPRRDIHAPDSIDLLKRCGIDFDKNKEKGIPAQRIAELLMSSGIVFNENVRWIAFHGAYDFGYLLKLLTCQNLPSTRHGFFRLMRLYFPKVYDVKHLIKFCDGLYGGLDRVAELLKVKRIGICHQAGSDSLLTSYVFMELRQGFLHTSSTETFAGILYGL